MAPRIGFLFLFFFLLLIANDQLRIAAQDTVQQSSAGTEVQDRQQQLSGLIPDPLPAQATPQAAHSYYTPETLYKYLDGGADAFLLYDFRTLLHQDFRTSGAEITVDIFDMGTSENAFGMYASERSPSYHFVPIGAEGYDNDGILNFEQGRYYVKLAGFGAGADVVLGQFAKGISARIKENPSLPPLLQLLPTMNRKAHSEQYLLTDPLGHSFLGPAYVASYVWGGQESTLLLSIAKDPKEAQHRLKLLAEHFQSAGQCEPAPELGEGAIRASSSFEGKAIAGAKGRYLVLLLNPVARGEAVFQSMLRRLE